MKTSEQLSPTLRLDISESKDTFNGLVYRGKGIENLVACVAIGKHQAIEVLIEKAIIKLIQKGHLGTTILHNYRKTHKL